jgi:hypothetical protein
MLRRMALVRTSVLEETFLRSMHQLLVSANVVPSMLIIVTLMMEALCSSETWFLQEPRGVTSQKTEFFSLYILLPDASSDLTR